MTLGAGQAFADTENRVPAGVAIDGNNDEDKERHIRLVKKRGKVQALDQELYSKWGHEPGRRGSLEIFYASGLDTERAGWLSVRGT